MLSHTINTKPMLRSYLRGLTCRNEVSPTQNLYQTLSMQVFPNLVVLQATRFLRIPLLYKLQVGSTIDLIMQNFNLENIE